MNKKMKTLLKVVGQVAMHISSISVYTAMEYPLQTTLIGQLVGLVCLTPLIYAEEINEQFNKEKKEVKAQ